MNTTTPTGETYQALQAAFDHFNGELFGGSLPATLITLQRKEHRVAGYFSPERFSDANGATVDEIAMNPAHFGDVREALGTLAHEMVHAWQQHHGKPSRKGYHNEEWAAKMDAIGLAPEASDGSGKRTGQKMTHRIVAGGPFDVAVTELLASPDFALRWREVQCAAKPAAKKTTRAKYVCTGCELAMWGKPGSRVICGDCDLLMPEEGAEPPEGAEEGERDDLAAVAGSVLAGLRAELAEPVAAPSQPDQARTLYFRAAFPEGMVFRSTQTRAYVAAWRMGADAEVHWTLDRSRIPAGAEWRAAQAITAKEYRALRGIA